MIVPRDRASFLQELLVAEVLARRGEGPLARKHGPRPQPRNLAPARAAQKRTPTPAEAANEPKPSR